MNTGLLVVLLTWGTLVALMLGLGAAANALTLIQTRIGRPSAPAETAHVADDDLEVSGYRAIPGTEVSDKSDKTRAA